MARKGILKSNLSNSTKTPAAPRAKAQGAVGALQSSLTRLQENAVQDIDPALIDSAGVEDRLGVDTEAQQQLRDSLKAYGQQVPVLLRPHPDKPGRFEIVYGRRRLAALKELGLPVKAMIRQLDDHALVMAQGQENTARQELSFIEKASFAAQLQTSGYERQTIADALSIDLPMLSRMLKVGGAFTLSFLRQIGSAPGIGRDRWLALAKLFEDKGKKSRAAAFMKGPEFVTLNSDGRFNAVLARAALSADAKRPAPRALYTSEGDPIGSAKHTAKGLTLNISAKRSGGFDEWLDQNAAELMKELHDRWKTK